MSDYIWCPISGTLIKLKSNPVNPKSCKYSYWDEGSQIRTGFGAWGLAVALSASCGFKVGGLKLSG